jgi:hypothetical protein
MSFGMWNKGKGGHALLGGRGLIEYFDVNAWHTG